MPPLSVTGTSNTAVRQSLSYARGITAPAPAMDAADMDLCSDGEQADRGDVSSAAASGDEDDGKLRHASPKRRNKRGGRQKGSGKGVDKKKGMRQCQGCFKYFKLEEFPNGSIFCNPDKRAIKNLKHAAERQGHSEWLEAQLKCPHKRKKLLMKYHEHCPTPLDGKKKNDSQSRCAC